jgi:hypothetical protein
MRKVVCLVITRLTIGRRPHAAAKRGVVQVRLLVGTQGKCSHLDPSRKDSTSGNCCARSALGMAQCVNVVRAMAARSAEVVTVFDWCVILAATITGVFSKP